MMRLDRFIFQRLWNWNYQFQNPAVCLALKKHTVDEKKYICVYPVVFRLWRFEEKFPLVGFCTMLQVFEDELHITIFLLLCFEFTIREPPT